jgi:hypothetical protein
MCFGIVALHGGKEASDVWSYLKFAYKSVPVVLVVVGFFVSYAWKWGMFRGWLVLFPDLNGTWQGEIRSIWTDPVTLKGVAPIPVILTIRQSFLQTSCVMRTEEMVSRSFLADFWIDGDHQIRKLGYSYHSEPKPTVERRSSPHDGTVVFELVDTPVTKLNGRYWTARSTTGEVELTFREKKLLEEFPKDFGTHPMRGN